MSPIARRPRTSSTRFPRVSGDEPFHARARLSDAAFSPRERG